MRLILGPLCKPQLLLLLDPLNNLSDIMCKENAWRWQKLESAKKSKSCVMTREEQQEGSRFLIRDHCRCIEILHHHIQHVWPSLVDIHHEVIHVCSLYYFLATMQQRETTNKQTNKQTNHNNKKNLQNNNNASKQQQ